MNFTAVAVSGGLQAPVEPEHAANKKPLILFRIRGLRLYQTSLDYVLVEAAGVEPASENTPL